MAHADEPEKQSAQEQAAVSDVNDKNVTEKTPADEGSVDMATEAVTIAADGHNGIDESSLGDESGMDNLAAASVDELLSQLESAREESTRFKDMALRSEAEIQNVLKRSQRDVEKAHRFGLEKFLVNLLPVIDSLEKAVESAVQAGESNAAIIEGIDLCLKMMLDIFAKENVKQLDPEGEPFDPQFHEAMSMIENGDVEPNTVVNVFQKGYTLNERLVRPAMVIVSRAPA